MTALENYLRTIGEIHASGAGVPETAYYAAFANLMNDVGAKLRPSVRCIINLTNQGAGIPDGGLFTKEQFPKASALEPLKGQIPARGAIEIKPPSEDVAVTVASKQVSAYLNRYRQVLATNLREFVLIGKDSEGNLVKLESFSLADTEAALWLLAVTPRKADVALGERFVEFLRRVMLHAAPISAPEDVAWFLASYARDAKGRIEGIELPTLAGVRAALEEALGLKFEGEKGDHFFRSSLVQTLFYGVFSAWVLWCKRKGVKSRNQFDWRSAAWHLRVPMISKLFHLIADPSQLDALCLSEVLDWTAQVLNRVEPEFFDRFQQSHAVQYFYEPFLKAFDPALRKELGVWFTPPEVVKYMVERVDAVLRTELGLRLGLADKNVYVLDPCCGTGSYLVEVLDRIHRTLREEGADALIASDLKDAARNRIFGFEILPAPFIVSHLQLGLLLENLGAPLSEKSHERVGVYLTNSLTGWEPPKGPKQHLFFPELEEERDRAEHVKREVPILVILGNPPYNAFAGVSPSEEEGLVDRYKQGLISEWGVKKFNLDDLYVRFFRLAERRIAEKTGSGIVCYISNFSYLSEPSFVVMRERFLEEFDKIWIDCLNGDSRATGKLTPDGDPDPSVFSTQHNRQGIRKGTAIGLMLRAPNRSEKSVVRFRHFWGRHKREDLLESLSIPDRFDSQYDEVNPDRSSRYSFRAQVVTKRYLAWPKIAELSAVAPLNGPIERRGNSLVVFDSDSKRLNLLKSYLDASLTDEQVKALAPAFMKSSGEFKAENTRKLLKGKVSFDESRIVSYPFKPFDLRVAYLDEAIQPLFSRPSPELLLQRKIPGNCFLITRDTADKYPEGPPFYLSAKVCDYDFISGHARHFPLMILPANEKKLRGQETIKFEDQPATANLSAAARKYLAQLGAPPVDSDIEAARLLWMHVLAVGYSRSYLMENEDGIRQDWPRIPLPATRELLVASAALGRRLFDLLAIESDPKESGPAYLQSVGQFRIANQKPLEEATHFALTAGWGHDSGGSTMPGVGKTVGRDYTPTEKKTLGTTTMNLLGEQTFDIYLNDAAFWSNIPARIWNYNIGGYQVIKKWLSYREQALLGRPLTSGEVRHVQKMIRRIALILLLQPELDASFVQITEKAYPWPVADN